MKGNIYKTKKNKKYTKYPTAIKRKKETFKYMNIGNVLDKGIN